LLDPIESLLDRIETLVMPIQSVSEPTKPLIKALEFLVQVLNQFLIHTASAAGKKVRLIGSSCQ